MSRRKGFGAFAVFMTSISSILGAVLFLRLGNAIGEVGLLGTIAVIILGHMVTVPTALAISELATNTRVEGGGEYFIISRSLGPKLGFTIGFTLFISEAISIAFYTIAFSQAFVPIADWLGYEIDTRLVSVPTLIVIAAMILRKGAGSGMKMLTAIMVLMGVSLLLFLIGRPMMIDNVPFNGMENMGFKDGDFFRVFAICFPAFTGITAGVGLSGDLRNPGKAIPVGTILATVVGFIIYIIVSWKLAVSAPESAFTDQLVMANIAVGGLFVILPGLAASTLSSAVGGVLVAPRTLQAIASDNLFPAKGINRRLAKGKGVNNEPQNATIVAFVIAMVFVVMGDVNSVAKIISMFFLITYGSLCLCSFLNHFGAPPSYRPRFRSRWYLSLGGFVVSIWIMFKINAAYTIGAYAVLVLLYLFVEWRNSSKRGLVDIFKGTLFQINRHLQLYLQKNQTRAETESADREFSDENEWRPSAICLSAHTFERERPMDMMRWLSYRHGFGTYTHLLEGEFTAQTVDIARNERSQIVKNQTNRHSALYIDTIIAPNYTTALLQVIQSPSISGMDTNLALFEYSKHSMRELHQALSYLPVTRAAGIDVAMLGSSDSSPRSTSGGIHVWLTDSDHPNTNFMILLGYIILSHPEWRRSHIKILIPDTADDTEAMRTRIAKRIDAGRLPITLANIEIVPQMPDQSLANLMIIHSNMAALTIVGFDETTPADFFTSLPTHGDTLLVSSTKEKEIR